MSVRHVIKQKIYEHVVFILRRHLILFCRTMLMYLVLLLIPIGFYFGIERLFPSLLAGEYTFPILVLMGSVYYFSVWLFFFTDLLNYYLDMWIVTNDRLMSIEQLSLFSRTVSETDLYKAQDVTSEVKGFFQTVFNYGNIYIQTAGTTERFIFEQVPHPNEIRTKIIDLANDDRKFHTKP